MSSDTVGVNLSQMSELQAAFEHRAAEIDELTAAISRLVGVGGAPGSVHWVGRVADDFRSQWDAVYVRNLHQAAEALREQARYVAENRRRSNLVLNGVDA